MYFFFSEKILPVVANLPKIDYLTSWVLIVNFFMYLFNFVLVEA